MNETMHAGFTVEELEGQHIAELPGRDLLAALTVLGLPLAGVSGVDANISGPRFLA